MKIAIQANPDRGKEIISLLESLGGENYNNWNGSGNRYFYYIDENNKIRYNYAPKGYKLYTLEEFEKEFPFKVGDKVIHKEFNDFFEVISFNPESSYPYKIKGVCEFSTKSYILTKWQPKMKEERFVTLTLDKAKEWYAKGGELKEIALQAFTEKELTKVDLPKTWEEFCNTHPTKKGEYYIDNCSDISSQCESTEGRDIEMDKNVCPSQKSAEAHLAMIQLEQLRDCWRQGWKPKAHESVCAIKLSNNGLSVYYFSSREFLSFPTRKMAEKFFECFRDLIEKAGDLI